MNRARPPDNLSRTLETWRVAPPRDPHFRAAVWERLAAGAKRLPWGDYVRRHAAAVGGVMVLAVVVGSVAGRGWARAHLAADSAKLAAVYVAQLDARAMTRR